MDGSRSLEGLGAEGEMHRLTDSGNRNMAARKTTESSKGNMGWRGLRASCK